MSLVKVRMGLVPVSIVIILQLLWIQSSHGRKFNAKEIAQVFSHAAKHYPKNISEPTGTITMKQVIDTKKGVTKYYLQADDGGYDAKSKPAFVRKKIDTNLKWLFIPKAKDRLYNWEKQSIVVLRQVPGKKKTDLYSALIIHFRVLTNNKLVYEWDDWRPRGYVKKVDCPCSLVDKFYRYCTKWGYCDLQYNTYDVSEDDSVADSRRRRGSVLGKQVEQTEVANRMPPGTQQAFGPFFWDLVDDQSEQNELYAQIIEFQKMNPEKYKYEEEEDKVPFSGYGDCPYWVKPGDFAEAQAAARPFLLLQFLSKAIRIQCILESEQQVVGDLFTAQLLYWDAKRGDVFFNTTHHLTTAINIDDSDLLNVEKALHIAAFSRMYDMITKNIAQENGDDKKRDATSPLGKKIHRNTRMIVLMTIKIFEMIQTSLKQHAVKLVKRLLANLKNNIMLNVEKAVSLEAQKNCKKEKACQDSLKILKKDQTQIVSLIYFVLFGTEAEQIDDIFDDEEGEGFDNWECLKKYGQFYEFHVKFLEAISAWYFEKGNIH